MKFDNARVHFNPRRTGQNWDRRGDNSYLRQVLSQARKDVDEQGTPDDDYVDLDINLKVLTKRTGIRAICNGKVLDTRKKKFRRWKRHDKKVIKELVREILDDARDDGKVGRRKAKKARKIATKRILSCFYGKSKKDD